VKEALAFDCPVTLLPRYCRHPSHFVQPKTQVRGMATVSLKKVSADCKWTFNPTRWRALVLQLTPDYKRLFNACEEGEDKEGVVGQTVICVSDPLDWIRLCKPVGLV
jgi:hypothetical protein